jgi:hypothetical protein
MQTKPKSNSVITHTLREDGCIVFTVLGAGEIVFDPSKVSEPLAQRAAFHGYIQRISDGGALSRNADTGRPATPEDKLARMSLIADHLMAGGSDWNLRVSSGPRGVDGGLIVMAIIKAGLAADVDAANALVDRVATKRDIDRAAALKVWAETEQVLRAIAEIKASRSKVDATDLLGEIEGA